MGFPVLVIRHLNIETVLRITSRVSRQLYDCPVPVKQPWKTWVNKIHKSAENYTTIQQSKTRPSAHFMTWSRALVTSQGRHNGHGSVSNHQPHDCLLNRYFRRRSKKTFKLRVTGLCAGKSPGTGEFPAQMASNAENVLTWWRHHDLILPWYMSCRSHSCSYRPQCSSVPGDTRGRYISPRMSNACRQTCGRSPGRRPYTSCSRPRCR